ncbi:hypothetical protein K458DRAFT_446863 [Lentithecium fluviatile CBS 122367]|uniref:Geranylgeranyl pyrophosphate synthetase n=1 Tax=Lentithecium fluviatile CBS 122367 TaxID=1168545 RepID=A0A6G1IHR6_9PLEO|nr:hypothetical protein K458DRAFT_446863 [Lentithecium fluviatile CBS 122367]
MHVLRYPGYGRGSFAPRRGRGGSQHGFTKRNEVTLDLVKHPLGELLTSFSNSDLQPKLSTLTDAASIKDCQYVASYNWVDADTPTIMVPGKPPLWSPLQQPRRLEEDSGLYFRDPNAARYPSYPTEPAVLALLEINPVFPTGEVDVFGCGSTMGNLLRFVRSVDKSFRFNVEAIGNTVFFVRKENDPRETIDGIRGYGHTFPEAYTTWETEVKRSESHQRLVQYDFGGFKCVVRFECDGYLPEKSNDKKGDSTKKGAQTGLDDLLEAFNNTAIKKGTPKLDGPLTVQSGGSPPPHHTIFDLKTRSGRFKKDIDMTDIYPALWLKQFPNFVVAYHDGAGTFHDIRVQDVKKDVQDWEKGNDAAIQRLAILIKKIVELARQDGKGLLEVYSPGVNRLEVRRQHGEGSHALPLELRVRWENGGDGGGPIVAIGDLSGSEGEYEDFSLADPHDSFSYDDSDDEIQDFTACSADSCGYCGKCTY